MGEIGQFGGGSRIGLACWHPSGMRNHGTNFPVVSASPQPPANGCDPYGIDFNAVKPDDVCNFKTCESSLYWRDSKLTGINRGE